ncbi:hypothetical protein [Ramlibacter rhizophilus]|uniref:hypothetical protein n=1 Tax=Ramlibacter rhizophilus TaxID=1781167 RepID=UPI0014326BE9|nr:hypothetical protein [Ramlibacter rhizophilus]
MSHRHPAETANSVKYRFADFTHEHYRELLAKAGERYVFRTYEDFVPGEAFVLWRHDLDFSVADALPLARIEAEQGVRATYFVLLNGDFYNPFSRANLERLREIVGLGHAIGLHFDFAHHRPADEADLCRHVRSDAQRLEDACGVPVRAFSFHNPVAESLAYDADRYATLVNTYARYFRDEVAYCSDSNGYWRHQRLQDVLDAPATRALQVLTHPTWWTAEVMSPHEKVERTVAELGRTLLHDYAAVLAAHGREDIDW